MRVTEPEVLEAVPLRNVLLYLAANGWREVERRPGRFTIWEYKDGQPRVMVPAAQDFADYALRIYAVLEALENVEHRSQPELVKDILALFADILRVRHQAEGSPDGSIPLRAGVDLIKHAQDLLLAAAAAAVTPRPLFYAKKPEPAEAYLRRARLGQTERGSFVVTIISPMYVSAPLFGELAVPEPFERQVTRTLMGSVAAAAEAARQSEALEDIGPFRGVVAQGVSANLCDALIALNEETDAVAIDISAKWAPGRDLPHPAEPDNVRIPRKLVPALREASRILKEGAAPEPILLIGAITDLHSEWRIQREGHEAAGMITVVGPAGGRVRRVRLSLPMPDYLRAVEAHRKGDLIRVRGILTRAGNYFELLSPHDLLFEAAEI